MKVSGCPEGSFSIYPVDIHTWKERQGLRVNHEPGCGMDGSMYRCVITTTRSAIGNPV